MMFTAKVLGVSAMGVVAAMAALPAGAVENGAPITPFGVFDFGAGMLPPPSDVATVGVRTTLYHSTDLRDNAGHRSPVGLDLTVASVGAAVIKMTNFHLLGGTYGYSAVLPYLDMRNALSIPTPAGPLALSGKDSAQGDLQIAPVIIQWAPAPGWYANASLQLQLPTGDYEKTRLINAGTNHWVISPTVAFTHILPDGLEVSSNIQLNVNGNNRATDYRSGLEYQHEFAVGQHVGPWTLGLGGYYYQQITDDRSAGQTVRDDRARAMALGPAVSFFDLGSGWPLVWAHFYREFGTKNRSQGSQLAIRAAWTF
jgi:hypothetical protein